MESLHASLTETVESLEAKSKAAEKFRRLFNEQKEKLAVFKRNKRKLMGDAAEKKQLYTMLECQVGSPVHPCGRTPFPALASRRAFSVWFLSGSHPVLFCYVGVHFGLQKRDASLSTYVLQRLHYETNKVAQPEMPSLQPAIRR